MTSLLQQLNNESLLLMYLADELPAADRAEVEQMLAGSAALRAELDELRAAYAGMAGALGAADSRERMPISSNVAARRVGRAVQSWHARRLATPAADGDQRRWRFQWWVYPLASTAAVVLVIVGWWAINPDIGPKELKPKSPMMLVMDDEDSPEYFSTPNPSATGDTLPAVPWETFAVTRDESDAVLDETEDQLYAIAESHSNGSEIFLMSETDEQ